MRLYEVTNGYGGDGPVMVIVLAKDAEEAERLASERFKKEARSSYYDAHVAERKRLNMDWENLKEYNYPEKYWKELHVEMIAEDLTKSRICYYNE